MYNPPEIETMQQAAEMIHEWFLSLMRAGFTEDQAMKIITSGGSE